IKARPVFDLVKDYLLANFDPKAVSEITWAPIDAVEQIARSIAANREGTMFVIGMGPNQFFNNDLKDRAIFLVAALTRNVGFLGGSVGSFSGNYRVDLFNGMPQYVAEDPFDIELDPAKPARIKKYDTKQSAHYFNYGDRPLRQKQKLFTGETHVPTPTKLMWLSNSNSIIANAKWHYDLVYNTLPQVECLAISDWWWTGSCEWADLVFAVDAWSEFKMPDMTASSTNPFVQVFPRTPLDRSFDTRGDVEVLAGVAQKLASITGDRRFTDYWRFALDNRVEVYLQRIIDASSALAGYRFEDLEAKAKQGIPALINVRTYPRVGGWEQTQESKPWYTRTGRLEFYRSERAFIDNGENIPVYREPIDSTFYEPNVIVGKPHQALRPMLPETFGQASQELSSEARQVRNIIKPWEELRSTRHPLSRLAGYRFIYHTPKYRHGAHSTPVDTDLMATWFGPFGDTYRRDKRAPFAGEGYVDINPLDAKELGIADGDYIWVEADPEDRPFRGWERRPANYQVGRLLLRARYYPGTPRGILRTWHNMYGSTPGSVKGARTRTDGLARNPETGYQSMYRYGSHQSATRSWLKPTQMTDTLVRKGIFTQTLGSGFEADVHCPTGASRESFVRISKAEPGGYSGQGRWRPAQLGFRPTSERAPFRRYLSGGFVRVARTKS
ncbi:MAG: molybdopterin-dependent oxidoreductase, partial [Cyanobacteria bacterium NC_groundwater_1444_Ag_S-0.65um_54_12]|nr:molybdopterin-dependent oxidoreductase [Cyanobacteria bacterium NC_groundwater_1444_Ag_S-0.65um_54_12]